MREEMTSKAAPEVVEASEEVTLIDLKEEASIPEEAALEKAEVATERAAVAMVRAEVAMARIAEAEGDSEETETLKTIGQVQEARSQEMAALLQQEAEVSRALEQGSLIRTKSCLATLMKRKFLSQ